MSETFALPTLARHTLLSETQRCERLRQALPQIEAVLEGEVNAVALQATLAALLWEALPHASWCGFYRVTAPDLLRVGPYQGPMGCLQIPFGKGVCGRAASSGEAQLVPDVHAFATHIACDAGSRSELVLPVFDARGVVKAVLDLDSHSLAAFCATEAEILAGLLARTFSKPALDWN